MADVVDSATTVRRLRVVFFVLIAVRGGEYSYEVRTSTGTTSARVGEGGVRDFVPPRFPAVRVLVLALPLLTV